MSVLDRIHSSLDSLTDRLVDLQARFSGTPTLRWGVVATSSPLTVQLDGDDAPIVGSVSSLVARPEPGERVMVAIQNRRLTIIGKARGEPSDTDWKNIPLQTGTVVYSSRTPQWCIRDRRLLIRGAVALSSGSFTTSYTQIFAEGAFPALPNIRDSFLSTRLYPAAGGVLPGRGFITGGGGMQIATTGGTAAYFVTVADFPIG